MKKMILFLILVMAATAILAQEFKVEICPVTMKCFPGEIKKMEVKVTNASDKDIWLVGRRTGKGISFEAGEFYNYKKGETLNCPNPNKEDILYGTTRPDLRIEKTLFKAGESYMMDKDMILERYCPISRDLTGIWKGKIIVTVRIANGDFYKDIETKK